MEKERWNKVRDIFSHLCDQSPSFRLNYLDMVCAKDRELRNQVERMLRGHDEVESHEAFQTPPPDNQTPDAIGEFQIDSELGRGGMGIVYRAHHTHHGTVALKVLPTHYFRNPVAASRFAQEASLLQKLNHPIICRVYETGVLQDHAFIAMEEISGQTLENVLELQPLSLIETTRIARELANGLTEAHRLGVVHRDIKPSNVILDSRQTPRLIDFGIARFADSQLTATGDLIGSPAYMSPEQWRGITVDHKTDVWSLGVLMFEMLSGTPPFARDSIGATAQNIQSGQPASLPQLCISGFPLSEVNSLIRQMLEKIPHNRPQNMAAVSRTLSQILETHRP